MNYLYTIFIAGLLPLAIASSVFIHDCKIDKALIYSLKAASGKKITKKDKKERTVREAVLSHDPHVHPEKAHKNLMNGFSTQTPATAPRIVRLKKSNQRASKYPGRHAFDNEMLPMLA